MKVSLNYKINISAGLTQVEASVQYGAGGPQASVPTPEKHKKKGLFS